MLITGAVVADFQDGVVNGIGNGDKQAVVFSYAYKAVESYMFARQFHLSEVEAYRYISRYQDIELLDEFYDVMHTQPFPDMVDSMAKYCVRIC